MGKADYRYGATNPNYKHGLSRTRLYNIRKYMLRRCYNPNCKCYAEYGGRGITVCPEWKDRKSGVQNFVEWALANGYREDLSIDRINVNEGYSPENCRWSDKTIQARNQRLRKDHAIYPGVSKVQGSCRYQARIVIRGKHHYLGVFDTAEEASEAYQLAKAERDKEQG